MIKTGTYYKFSIRVDHKAISFKDPMAGQEAFDHFDNQVHRALSGSHCYPQHGEANYGVNNYIVRDGLMRANDDSEALIIKEKVIDKLLKIDIVKEVSMSIYRVVSEEIG